MNGSHIAGAGFGAILGAILVSLGSKIGLDLTNYDAATLGMAAIAAGLAVGHAVGAYGVKGIVGVVWNGRATAKATVYTTAAPVAVTQLPPPPAA